MPFRRSWRKAQVISLAAMLAWVAGCGSRETPPPTGEKPVTTPIAVTPATVAPVQIELKNVRLHIDDGIILNVRSLRGEMVTKGQDPPVFDDPRSYVMSVFTGDMGMDMASLTNLMNRHIFAYEGSPLKDITVEIKDGKLKQQGKLHKGVWLPFSMKATVAATPDGRLKLHTESVSALGIPTMKLLDLLGLSLADLMTVEKQRGVEIRDDDVIISPGRALPPPAMQGHLSHAEIRDGELRQVFTEVKGRAIQTLTPPDRKARNYFYFSGSVIRFGKLTMTGADLQLIDIDERDAFDFHAAKYNLQLVAGYSKNTPAKGLKTYMPDFGDLKPGLDVRPPRR